MRVRIDDLTLDAVAFDAKAIAVVLDLVEPVGAGGVVDLVDWA